MTDEPRNLIHIALARQHGRMLTSPDGKRIEIDLDAVVAVVNDYRRRAALDEREACARISEEWDTAAGVAPMAARDIRARA